MNVKRTITADADLLHRIYRQNCHGAVYQDPTKVTQPSLLELMHDTPTDQSDFYLWLLGYGTPEWCPNTRQLIAVQVNKKNVKLYSATFGPMPTQCGGRVITITPHTIGSLTVRIPIKEYRKWVDWMPNHPHVPNPPAYRTFTHEFDSVYRGWSTTSIHAGILSVDVVANNKNELALISNLIRGGIKRMRSMALSAHHCMRMFRSVSAVIQDMSTPSGSTCKLLAVVHLKTNMAEVEGDKDIRDKRLNEDVCIQSAEFSRDVDEPHHRLPWSKSGYHGPIKIRCYASDLRTNFYSYAAQKTTVANSYTITIPHYNGRGGLDETELRYDVAKAVVADLVLYKNALGNNIVILSSNRCNRFSTQVVMGLLAEHPSLLAEEGLKVIRPADVAINQGEGFHVIDSIHVVSNSLPAEEHI